MAIKYYPRDNYYIGLSTDDLSLINQEGAKIYLVDTQETKINHAGVWYDYDNANLLGYVGIDQTTDGTTNKVQARNSLHDNFNINANLQINNIDNSLSNPAFVQVTGSNVELLAKTTITWDGTDTTNNVEVSPASGDVLIWAKNTADQELTVTLEHEVEEGVFAPYMDGAGTAISFKIPASTGEGVYGVFQKFPKYLGGRVVLTAGSAPTASGTTSVQVQEV